jgi:low temperature requirement protein LtrA
MDDRQIEREQRVTPLELFFDLVFVFAITQVTGFLSHSPTWGGLPRGLLLLGALWWAWGAYAWLTNTLDPEEGAVRLAVLAAIAALLIVSLAAPGAFGRDGVIFAVAYLVVRALHLVLYGIAGRGDRDLFRAVVRLVPTATLGPALLVIAGFLDGSGQLALWGAALAIDYLGPLVGGMRGWRISPAHFVERFGLIIIIALGESIVAIGVGAADLPLDAGVIAAALLGITVVACLWWSYFDWVIFVAQAALAQATAASRAALARDAYSYLHLPMVGGIVLFAFGLETTLHDVEDPLRTLPALGLCGGIALYLLAHVALRLRIGGGLGHGRPIATILLLGLLPVARDVPALTALGLVAAVCVSLIGYEAIRYREGRAWIRSRRGAFTMEEAARAGSSRGRDDRSRAGTNTRRGRRRHTPAGRPGPGAIGDPSENGGGIDHPASEAARSRERVSAFRQGQRQQAQNEVADDPCGHERGFDRTVCDRCQDHHQEVESHDKPDGNSGSNSATRGHERDLTPLNRSRARHALPLACRGLRSTKDAIRRSKWSLDEPTPACMSVRKMSLGILGYRAPHRITMTSNKPSTSRLDPKDVTVHVWRHTGPEATADRFGTRMCHVPTGAEVSGEIPPGPHAQDEMRRLRAELRRRLWAELEMEVARRSE